MNFLDKYFPHIKEQFLLNRIKKAKEHLKALQEEYNEKYTHD